MNIFMRSWNVLSNKIRRNKYTRFNIKRGKHYWKTLSIILTAACIPVAIVGVMCYSAGTGQVRTEVDRTHAIQLKQAYNYIDSQLLHVQSISNEWAFNPLFPNDLKDIDLGVNYERNNEVLGTLRVMKHSSPLISDIKLFIRNNYGDIVMSYSEGFYYVKNKEETEYYKSLLDKKESFFWIDSCRITSEKGGIGKALVWKVPGAVGKPYGLLIVILDTEAISDTISQMDINQEGASFILDEDGGWIACGTEITGSKSSLYEFLRSEILGKAGFTGSFSYRHNNKNYFVSLGILSRNGWRFVIATPIDSLMALVVNLSKMIIICCSIVFIFAVAMSIYASGRSYLPVSALLKMINSETKNGGYQTNRDELTYIENQWSNVYSENREIRSKLESSKEIVKKGILLQLIQGHMDFLTEEELREQFRQYWWEPQGIVFSPILVKIARYATDNTDFHKGEEQLVTFAATNIAEKVADESGVEAAVINLHDLSLALLVAYDSIEEGMAKTGMLHLSQKLISAMDEYLKVPITVAIGRPTPVLHEVGKVVDETRQALRYRDLNKKEQIIDIGKLIVQGKYKIDYPYSIEKSFLDYLRLGMEGEAMAELNRFIEKYSEDAGKELIFKQGIFQLLGNSLQTISKSGSSSNILCPGVDFYDELGKITDPEEISAWFMERIVAPYVHEILNERKQCEESSIEEVLKILSEEYSSPVSLDSCADKLGMTPYNLSREFKQYTGVNFIDYLTKLRLDKAKELLRNTSLTINEVAEAVGYQPNYFTRIYKKVEGITPGQFRGKNN